MEIARLSGRSGAAVVRAARGLPGNFMLTKPTLQTAVRAVSRPRTDLQQHLADLEAAGLLIRIDRAINKDTELNPLVRWQFIGGVPEEQRRAFLFTNVTDSKGKRYD